MPGPPLLRLEGDERGRDEGGWRRRLSGGRQGARRVRAPSGGNTATLVIVGVCVVAFLAETTQGVPLLGASLADLLQSSLVREGALLGPWVADGEWWRLITSSFLHVSIIHLAFNMYLLWILGSSFEGYVGTDRFLAIYFIAVLWGAAGALLLSPDSLTLGASGGVFGLMAAIVLMERQRGIGLLNSPVGLLLGLNLVFTFLWPGISIGGHLGGIVGGAAAAFILSGYGKGSLAYGQLNASSAAGLAALTVGAIGVALYAA